MIRSTPTLMNGETLLSFHVLARNVPGHRNNPHANSATLFRWATKGVKTARGVVRLEAVRLGGAWRSSREALARFSQALTEASLPPADDTPPAPAPATPAARDRAARRASEELAAKLA